MDSVSPHLPQLAIKHRSEVFVQRLKKSDRSVVLYSNRDLLAEDKTISKFLLLFDKSCEENKVCYLLMDNFSKHPKPLPKCSYTFMTRLKDIYGYRVLTVNNDMYLLGGRHVKAGSYLNQCYRYDSRSSMWIRRASMIKARTKFAAVVKDGCIYVTGGEARGGVLLDSVEIYDPRVDLWMNLRAMPKPRADHAICVRNQKIFVTGGVGRPSSSHRKNGGTNSFWAYDLITDRWTVATGKSALPWSKERHSMIEYRGRIYCIGGVSYKRSFDDKQRREVEDESILEFNVEENVIGGNIAGEWTCTLPPIPTPRVGAGVTVLGHNIYVIGGRSASYKKPLHKIEYFNTRKKRWYELFDLPESMGEFWDLDVAVLAIPSANTEFSNLGRALHDKWVLW